MWRGVGIAGANCSSCAVLSPSNGSLMTFATLPSLPVQAASTCHTPQARHSKT
jgi:hypothetical protein